MVRARHSGTTPKAAAGSKNAGPSSSTDEPEVLKKVETPKEKVEKVITDEPPKKKAAARKAPAVKEGLKVYRLVEGSVVRKEGPDVFEFPAADELYTTTFAAPSPVAAAKKAFARIYKGVSPAKKKGVTVSDKPSRIVYNLVIVDTVSGKHFPYIASHLRRKDPSVVKKGDGVMQFSSDGTKKNWASAQAAAASLGGVACNTLEELQSAYPDSEWKPSVFVSHFETNVKAFKDEAGASGSSPSSASSTSSSTSTSSASPSPSSSASESSDKPKAIEKKRVPQAPKKPVQTPNVPAPRVEEAETPAKPAGKGRARVVRTEEPAEAPKEAVTAEKSAPKARGARKAK